MEETPQWSIGGAYSVFPYLAKRFGLKTFVETGTAFGEMIVHMYPTFDNLYTIERNDWCHRVSTAVLKEFTKVELLHGDSGAELAKLLKRIPNQPTFFWLDAHGPTPGVDDGPIAAEIAAIIINRPNSLIAIDDVGPGRHHDQNLSSVYKAGVSLSGWTLDYRFNRVLFLHKGQFDIPYLGE
jgi:hypothetical protein